MANQPNDASGEPERDTDKEVPGRYPGENTRVTVSIKISSWCFVYNISLESGFIFINPDIYLSM